MEKCAPISIIPEYFSDELRSLPIADNNLFELLGDDEIPLRVRSDE
jgi:hypothetical protein